MSGLLVSQPPFPFQVWPCLGEKPRLCRLSWRAFAYTHSLMLLSTSPKEVVFACPPSPPWNLPPSLWSPPFPLHAPAPIPLSRQGAVFAHLDSFPPHDLVPWTDGSIPLPFAKGSYGVLANCSLCNTKTTLSFSGGPVCASFSAKACAILPSLCWSRQHQQVCHFFSLLLLSDSYSVLANISCPPFFLSPQFLWEIWLSFLSSCSIKLQWVPGHLFLPGDDAADELARRGAQVELTTCATRDLNDLWSRPWGVARLLELHGLLPCPYLLEGFA